MKKIGVMLILVLLAFSVIPLTISEVTNESTDSSENETVTSNVSSESGAENDKEKIEEAFKCLEDKAGDCSKLTVQEIALTILATPKDETFDDCVSVLKSRKKSDNWGNVRDTAFAVLALSHAGKDTEASEEWLLKQSRNPTDLIWYLQQDSVGATSCNIKYDSKDYTVNVEENKKLDRNAGNCLTRTQSNFWYLVNPSCYEEEFLIECDKDFIGSLLYKNKNSPTLYVLEGTKSSPAFKSITLSVKSKCFGASSCDYEGTVWATAALLINGYDVEDYIPYIIAMSETNKRYLPEAFIHLITEYEDYSIKLGAMQELGSYWEADSSAYNKVYDTSLAILSLGSSSSEQVTKAKDWILFSQKSNGCWENNVRDTAMALWVLEGRIGRSPSGGTTTLCTQANYFCIPSSDCPTEQDLGRNSYFCPSLSDTCCMTENLRSCSENGGEVCGTDLTCIGIEKQSTDTNACCIGECAPKPTKTECELNGFACVPSQCSSFQEEASYSCNTGDVCCKMKIEEKSSGSSWWIWVLLLLILIVLGAIGWIKRDNLKLFFFKLKSKFRKDKGGSSSNHREPPMPPSSSMPPKPGFPPIRRMPQGPPVRRNMPPRGYPRRDPGMDETFRKLRDIADKK